MCLVVLVISLTCLWTLSVSYFLLNFLIFLHLLFSPFSFCLYTFLFNQFVDFFVFLLVSRFVCFPIIHNWKYFFGLFPVRIAIVSHRIYSFLPDRTHPMSLQICLCQFWRLCDNDNTKFVFLYNFEYSVHMLVKRL